MTKLLKLANIETYIGEATRSGTGNECIPVRKGQVCLFEDSDAETALAGSRLDREHNEVPFFTELTDYVGKIDHDFTEARRESGNSVKHTDKIGVDTSPRAKGVAQPDPVPAAKPAATSQRAPRRAPATSK
jgi:hypothetical protein